MGTSTGGGNVVVTIQQDGGHGGFGNDLANGGNWPPIPFSRPPGPHPMRFAARRPECSASRSRRSPGTAAELTAARRRESPATQARFSTRSIPAAAPEPPERNVQRHRRQWRNPRRASMRKAPTSDLVEPRTAKSISPTWRASLPAPARRAASAARSTAAAAPEATAIPQRPLRPALRPALDRAADPIRYRPMLLAVVGAWRRPGLVGTVETRRRQAPPISHRTISHNPLPRRPADKEGGEPARRHGRHGR